MYLPERDGLKSRKTAGIRHRKWQTTWLSRGRISRDMTFKKGSRNLGLQNPLTRDSLRDRASNLVMELIGELGSGDFWPVFS